MFLKSPVGEFKSYFYLNIESWLLLFRLDLNYALFLHVGPLCLASYVINSRGVVCGDEAELRVTSALTWSDCSLQSNVCLSAMLGVIPRGPLSSPEHFRGASERKGKKEALQQQRVPALILPQSAWRGLVMNSIFVPGDGFHGIGWMLGYRVLFWFPLFLHS